MCNDGSKDTREACVSEQSDDSDYAICSRNDDECSTTINNESSIDGTEQTAIGNTKDIVFPNDVIHSCLNMAYGSFKASIKQTTDRYQILLNEALNNACTILEVLMEDLPSGLTALNLDINQDDYVDICIAACDATFGSCNRTSRTLACAFAITML